MFFSTRGDIFDPLSPTHFSVLRRLSPLEGGVMN